MHLYNVLVTYGCVGGGLLVCIWIDIYNGGLLVFCACVYLSDDMQHPKIKQFSRINTVYMQKSAENRIFLYGYMQNDLENQNPKSRLHCAICKYHLEN